MRHFSLARTWAVFVKEFQQILRDRLTFAMAVGIPILQLVLFGYAINSDPKQLPTAVVTAEQGPLVRSLLTALQHSDYFRVVQTGEWCLEQVGVEMIPQLLVRQRALHQRVAEYGDAQHLVHRGCLLKLWLLYHTGRHLKNH